ncbi:protein FAM216A isoform X2 [Ranitomeya imitator]|uniref:protein FAM216A isoform X2 n=1 Tax=Ranitomeya imitator TaxID=111125 RepID=UPI0037E7F86F
MEGHAVCNAKEKEMPPDVKQDQKKVTVRTMDFSHKDIEEGTHANRNSKAPQKGCKLQSVPLRQQVKTVKIPRTMKNEAYLKHADLTLGQKRYLCSIAKIYSTGNMRALTEKHLRSQIRCASGCSASPQLRVPLTACCLLTATASKCKTTHLESTPDLLTTSLITG